MEHSDISGFLSRMVAGYGYHSGMGRPGKKQFERFSAKNQRKPNNKANRKRRPSPGATS